MLLPVEKTALGSTIETRNPYSFMAPAPGHQGMTLAPDWLSRIQEGAYTETFWDFKGQEYQVIRAVRIPYTYEDAHGNTIEEYLLIGYTGTAGV